MARSAQRAEIAIHLRSLDFSLDPLLERLRMDGHRCAALAGAFTAPPTLETKSAGVTELTVLPAPTASESDHRPARCRFYTRLKELPPDLAPFACAERP